MNAAEIAVPKEPVYRFIQIPVSALIANTKAERKENQAFAAFWKGRRNGNIAMKLRFKHGPDHLVTMDRTTLSVVTPREMYLRGHDPKEEV